MRRLIAVAVLLPLLTACGSNAPRRSAAPQFDNVGQVVNKANLKSCVPSGTGHAYVNEVTCGDRAVVLFFDTEAQRSKWVSNYLVNGLPPGAGVLYAGRWGIACIQRATCSSIRDNLDGTLKP